jgi:Glycosyl hydrolase 108
VASIKRKSIMANFEDAWAFTRTWEGEYEMNGTDSGHYFPRATADIKGWSWSKRYVRTKMGTNFGVTPQFLFDYVPGWQYPDLPTRNKMTNLTEDAVKEIWRGTAWKWCGGDDISDQNIATLLFDFMVRSNGDCWNNCPQVLGLTKEMACYKINYVTLGTRIETDIDEQRNQKIYPFNQVFVDKINAYSDPKVLFNKFKAKLTRHAAVRKNALQYDNMQYNTMRYGLTQNSTPTPWTTWAMRAGAVWLGGKIFKIW